MFRECISTHVTLCMYVCTAYIKYYTCIYVQFLHSNLIGHCSLIMRSAPVNQNQVSMHVQPHSYSVHLLISAYDVIQKRDNFSFNGKLSICFHTICMESILTHYSTKEQPKKIPFAQHHQL